MMTSARSVSALGEGADSTPRAVAFASAPSATSKAATSRPASRRLRQSAKPMAPTPIRPTFAWLDMRRPVHRERAGDVLVDPVWVPLEDRLVDFNPESRTGRHRDASALDA